jgi:hypothetical protein
MERNKLLRYSLYFCRLLQVIQVAAILLLTGILIHWHFDPDYYAGIKFDGTLHYSLNRLGLISSEIPDSDKVVFLNKIRPFFFYLIFLKNVGVILFTWIIIREFGKVIRSLQQLETFRSRNVESFRRIARGLLVIFILSGVTFMVVGNTGDFTFNFDLTLAFLTLVAFILAEIFKEGNRLYEEEQLTI